MNRRKQYRPRTRPNHERWLVSYADFITLLFAFFVVLYASSQGDQRKTARLAVAISDAFQELGLGPTEATGNARVVYPELQYTKPADTPQLNRVAGVSGPMTALEFRALHRELEQALSQEIERGEVTLRTTPDGLVVSLQEIGFFDSGSATLRANSQASFARIAGVLQERHCKLRIEGHTDTIPIHTSQFESNWELSTARATGLVRVLIQKYHYDPASLAAGGYAEYQPIVSNATAEGRSKNRRVDLVIVSAVAPGETGAGKGDKQWPG